MIAEQTELIIKVAQYDEGFLTFLNASTKIDTKLTFSRPFWTLFTFFLSSAGIDKFYLWQKPVVITESVSK